MDWEAALMFHEIVIAVDGCAEIRGHSRAQKPRGEARPVKRHLPYLAEMYNGLYGLSLEARHYDGYSMTEKAWRRATQCHEILARNIPVQ